STAWGKAVLAAARKIRNPMNDENRYDLIETMDASPERVVAVRGVAERRQGEAKRESGRIYPRRILTSRSSARYTRSDTPPASNTDNNRLAGSNAPDLNSERNAATKSRVLLSSDQTSALPRQDEQLRKSGEPEGSHAILARSSVDLCQAGRRYLESSLI